MRQTYKDFAGVMLACLAVACVFAMLGASVNNMRLTERLNTIRIIMEQNAHENPQSWTVIEIIKGE